MKIDTVLTRRLRDALLEVGLEGEGATHRRVADPSGLTAAGLTAVQQANLERVLPMFETLYLMMVADFETSDSERAALRGALATLTGDSLSGEVLDWMLESFEKNLREQGRDSRLHQLGALLCADPADSELAFSLAAAVALADGRVDSEERRLVEELAESFGISPKRAASILEDVADD